MTTTAILLILLSAFSHAYWNLRSKKGSFTRITFFMAMGTPFLAAVIMFLLAPQLFTNLPLSAFGWLVLSGIFRALYFSALAVTYQNDDMTAVYPIVRAVPILIVTLVSLLLGRSHAFSVVSLAGMLLVFSGCLLVPLDRRGVAPQTYFTRQNALILLAAIGIAGFMLVDDAALRILRTCECLHGSNLVISTVSILLSFSGAFLWLGLAVLFSPKQRAGLRSVTREQTGSSLLTGLIISGTYLLVLIALAHVRDVSYATTFRQASIVIGLLLCVIFLKEKPGGYRVAGTLIIFVGLVMVALG